MEISDYTDVYGFGTHNTQEQLLFLAVFALMVKYVILYVAFMKGGPSYLESGNVVCGPRGVHHQLVGVTSTIR